MDGTVRIGTAGWSIPEEHAHHFPEDGTHLARYARVLSGVEITSSFYRPHPASTYARWAEGIPETFRFAAKVPREITHERRLEDAVAPLARFLEDVAGLGHALGPLLLQFPPSLRRDAERAEDFLSSFRRLYSGLVALEPRHPSWFTDAADEQFRRFRIARVAADPAVVRAAGEPGGWRGLSYWRCHGAPKLYHSTYSSEALDALAERIRHARAAGSDCWCTFDNTALGEATRNALALTARLA